MKIRNVIFSLLIVSIFLFSSCTENKTANTFNNQNNPYANPTSDKNSSDFSDKNVDDKTSTKNVNTKTDDRANLNSAESSDFTGTAENIIKENKIESTAVLQEVRSGEHKFYDRVVFEFEGKELPNYYIEYIDKPVRLCGSGNTVELKGGSQLEIRFTPAQAHTVEGKPTVKNREQNPNYKILKQLKSTCDFEGNVTWVLGVSKPNKYRVLELKNPNRLAIDIKH